MTKLSDLPRKNLYNVFSERNEARRRAALKEIWADEGVLWTSNGTYVGYQAISRAVATLLDAYPEYDFQPVGDVDEIPNVARLRWALGAMGFAPALTGLDVIVAVNGRIRALYKFMDGAAF